MFLPCFRAPLSLKAAFPSSGRRMGPGSPQKAILEHFQTQAAEWAEEAPITPFWKYFQAQAAELVQEAPRKPF